MTAPFELTDDSVVVVIGTGAGGGVLANELAQRGVGVVALEAGGRYLPEDYLNDEWDAFAQLSWLDPQRSTCVALASIAAGEPGHVLTAHAPS